jgi:hypothetical protein
MAGRCTVAEESLQTALDAEASPILPRKSIQSAFKPGQQPQECATARP